MEAFNNAEEYLVMVTVVMSKMNSTLKIEKFNNLYVFW